MLVFFERFNFSLTCVTFEGLLNSALHPKVFLAVSSSSLPAMHQWQLSPLRTSVSVSECVVAKTLQALVQRRGVCMLGGDLKSVQRVSDPAEVDLIVPPPPICAEESFSLITLQIHTCRMCLQCVAWNAYE